MRPAARSHPLAASLLVLVAGPPMVVAAQSPPEDVVPTELVTALMSGRGNTTLTVGTTPPSIAGVLPFDELGRVVGGMSDIPGAGTVVIEFGGDPRQALRGWGAWMEGQGWVRPEPARPESGGFVTTDTRGVFRGWCGPEHMATVSTAGSDLGTFVRVSIRPIRQTPCDPEMAARLVTRGIPRTSLEIPALAPPDGGVEVSFGGGGSSDDYAESEARITGPIAADGLLDHYGAQLEALGWLAGDRLGATDASVGRWTGEVDGEPAIAMLNFIRLDGDVTRGSLRIQLADSARWR